MMSLWIERVVLYNQVCCHWYHAYYIYLPHNPTELVKNGFIIYLRTSMGGEYICTFYGYKYSTVNIFVLFENNILLLIAFVLTAALSQKVGKSESLPPP